MGVKVEKSFEVQEPIQKVWDFLSDPKKVVVCVPGAQITEQVDDRHYKGAISVKVGPTVSDFKGQVEIVKLDPAAYEIGMLGKGQDARGKGSASMTMTGKLREVPGGTEVVSVSEMNVVGILAQMGGRMIQEVSNIMFDKFSANFKQALQGLPASAGTAQPISGLGLAFSAIKATFGGGASSESEDKPKDGTTGKS
jgi:carbon monoxide dehydrogenase subunit G